jgi:hypothetical protein
MQHGRIALTSSFGEPAGLVEMVVAASARPARTTSFAARRWCMPSISAAPVSAAEGSATTSSSANASPFAFSAWGRAPTLTHFQAHPKRASPTVTGSPSRIAASFSILPATGGQRQVVIPEPPRDSGGDVAGRHQRVRGRPVHRQVGLPSQVGHRAAERVREIIDQPAPLESAFTALQHRQVILADPREPGHQIQGQPTMTTNHPGTTPNLGRLPAHQGTLGHRTSPQPPTVLARAL